MSVETSSSHSRSGDVQTSVLGLSPTHRALFCQEIAEAIFGHLSLKSEIFTHENEDSLRQHHVKAEQRARRQALVSASRVSKYISELALSVLWAQQLGFDRPYHLLPISTWDWKESQALNGDPTDEQWATLQKYAALIRGVFYYSDFLEPYEKSIWTTILNRFGSISNLLPRLTELGVLHVDPRGPMAEPFLLSPTLRHLSIEFHALNSSSGVPEGGTPPTTALEHIAAAIPSLSSLNIDRGLDVERISWTLPPFKALRKLDITPEFRIDASNLAAIAQFQHLRMLSIRIAAVDCTHLQGALQSLTELRLGGRPHHIQSFLAATSPPHLQHLSLFFLPDRDPSSLTQCLPPVLASVPPTLSFLHLESSVVFAPTLASAMDVVQPALALRTLTHFTLKLHPLPSVSDADILAMLAAWPRLTALRIPKARHPASEPGDPAPPGTRPTAHVLPLLAARGPLLHEVVLPEVDLAALPAAEPDSYGSASEAGQAGHGLRALDLVSRCGDRRACVRAAVMLDRLFPRMLLPAVRGDGCGEKEEKGWAAVVRMLEAMQAGRRHGEALERVWSERGDGDGDGESEGTENSSGSGSEDGDEDKDEDGDEDGDEGEDEDGSEDGDGGEDRDINMGLE